MIDNRAVGKRISAMRQRNGLTQQQLAAMMNVSHQAVSKWESGQALPDIQIMIELTRFFGITIEQLISNEEEAFSAANIDENAYDPETSADNKRESEGKAQKEAGSMSIQQLLQMAPYMSRETVEEIAMEIEEPLTGGQLARIAPYVKPDCLEKLIEKHHPEFSWEHLRRIAPFMRREAVDLLARRIAEGRESIKPASDNINKAINDIGKAFDDIGRGMGKAMKKAIRFGENVINEVSAAFNDISADAPVEAPQPVRSERALALRKKAFERALADTNWSWIAAHIRETENDPELRSRIAAAAREKDMNDWICSYLGEYADEAAVDGAIEAGNWAWLGENAARFDSAVQEKLVMAAVHAGNWEWIHAHAAHMSLANCGQEAALAALRAGEDQLALNLVENHLAPEAVSALAYEAYAQGKMNLLEEFVQLSSDDVSEKILLDLAEKQNWDHAERFVQYVGEETIEKLMEIAVDQGNFDAVDMLDQYM